VRGLLVGMLLMAASVPASMPPAVECQSTKLWVAARYVARRSRCHTGRCSVASTAKMRRGFAKLERSLPCLTRGDSGPVEDGADRLKTRLRAMVRRRTPACRALLVAATARLGAALVDADRPSGWPPVRDRRRSDAMTAASDAFDHERVEAKSREGCRSVVLGPKLTVPAEIVELELAKTLRPPPAATGLTLALPSGWHVHDVQPGSVTFVTFAEYGHGGVIP
jgi:hypothetical protein